jgi:hypothetical protein
MRDRILNWIDDHEQEALIGLAVVLLALLVVLMKVSG